MTKTSSTKKQPNHHLATHQPLNERTKTTQKSTTHQLISTLVGQEAHTEPTENRGHHSAPPRSHLQQLYQQDAAQVIFTNNNRHLWEVSQSQPPQLTRLHQQQQPQPQLLALPLPFRRSPRLTETESMPRSTLLFDDYPRRADPEDLAAQAEEEEEEDYWEHLEEEDHLEYHPHNWSPYLRRPTSSNSEQDPLSSRETDD